MVLQMRRTTVNNKFKKSDFLFGFFFLQNIEKNFEI